MSFPPADPRSAAQAIDALRRGWPIVLADGGRALHLLAVETADAAGLAAFDAQAGVSALLLSGERAATLKITNQLAAAEPGPVLIERESRELAKVTAIADPALDLAAPMKGPFTSIASGNWPALPEALALLRHAGLLPAAFVALGDAEGSVLCDAEGARRYDDDPQLFIAARARLPISRHADAEIIAFRSRHDGREHVALIVGQRDETLPVVRLHSECLTGDVLGSLKCDCGPQLHSALDTMAGSKWGVLLYLRQEGRGIGLINKLRAYQLQDQGHDTVEANLRLGFPIEARDFATAAAMLRLMGIGAVKLLTNNPAKVERMTAEGIDVAERLPLALAANPHNAAYLATKRDKTGHLL